MENMNLILVTLRLERYPAQHVVSARNGPLWSTRSSECQMSKRMSKRKPATASKHARSPKIAAKAQRAAQAIVRSPKDSRLRSAGAGTTESPPKRPDDSQQEALLVENPVTALHDDYKQTMTDSDSKKWTNLSLATTNVRPYQAQLLEMAQANMQLASEFAQRLATIRSPVEFFSVIAEFTNKRIAMFWKYSKEMAELDTKRWIA
jgi:hypothetical protein